MPRISFDRGDSTDIRAKFLVWTFARAVFHRGYVLVASLYFVTVAHLIASELILLGTVGSVTLLLSDIPTGVWSDSFSRRWPLVIGHAFLATGMVMTGLVTAFPPLLLTQVLWGMGWGFSSGADVAWVTDELDRPHRIARVLTARARCDMLGSACGMLAFGILGWVSTLATAVIVSGMAMSVVGLFVAGQFTERRFRPTRGRCWRTSVTIFRKGLGLAHHDHEIRLVLLATLLVNGAGIVSSLFPKQLIKLGFPNDFILWYTALGILAFVLGATALRIVEARIDGVGVAQWTYAVACFIGVVGLVTLAYAPNAVIAGLGLLLVSGVTFNVTRAVGVVWVNRRVTTDVRTTVHSFLGQAEYAGEIGAGFVLAALSKVAGISVTLVTSGLLIAGTGAMVALSGSSPSPRWRRKDE